MMIINCKKLEGSCSGQCANCLNSLQPAGEFRFVSLKSCFCTYLLVTRGKVGPVDASYSFPKQNIKYHR